MASSKDAYYPKSYVVEILDTVIYAIKIQSLAISITYSVGHSVYKSSRV